MHALPALAHPGAPLFALVAGVLLLTLGHRLFWLSVGLVGFFSVYSLSLEAFHGISPGLRLGLAVFAGLVGIVLAIFLQKVGIGLAGFFVGAWAAAGFLHLNLHATPLPLGPLVVVVAAGILAALLAYWLFDFGLIVVSSIAGGGLIAGGLGLAGQTRMLAILVLALVGIAIQAGWTRRRKARA
jgi:hypothetical protein